jgi:hypothetical protein
MKFFDRLFRRNKESKTKPVIYVKGPVRVGIAQPSLKRKKVNARKKRNKQSKASRRKNR